MSWFSVSYRDNAVKFQLYMYERARIHVQQVLHMALRPHEDLFSFMRTGVLQSDLKVYTETWRYEHAGDSSL